MLPELALNHLNLPARDPGALRTWYAATFGFRAHGPFLWSAGTQLAFVRGEPLASGSFHFGFRVASVDDLHAWIAALRARGVDVGEIGGEGDYVTTRVLDPEGNEIELYAEPVPAP